MLCLTSMGNSLIIAPMKNFKEKYGPWAVITGASSGIGAEFAHQLAARGLNVVLVARRAERLNKLARQLQVLHEIQTRTVVVDLTQPDFLAAIEPVLDELDIGLLVANAGFGLMGDFILNDYRRELAMVDLNVRAPMILAHRFGNYLVAKGRGGMIFTSSMMSAFPSPLMTNYAATKAYTHFFGKALHYELKEKGVDVLALDPSLTRTEFHQIAGTPSSPIAMDVEPVVKEALAGLGRKAVVLPGVFSKILFALAHLLPTRLVYLMFRQEWRKRQLRKPTNGR